MNKRKNRKTTLKLPVTFIVTTALLFIIAIVLLKYVVFSQNRYSHIVKSPREIPGSSDYLPREYRWAYLGMTYGDFKEKMPGGYVPYQGVVDTANGYKAVFNFNNDCLDDKAFSVSGPPADTDRLTKLTVYYTDGFPFDRVHLETFDFIRMKYADGVTALRLEGPGTVYALREMEDIKMAVIPYDLKGKRYLVTVFNYPVKGDVLLDPGLYSYQKFTREPDKDKKIHIDAFKAYIRKKSDPQGSWKTTSKNFFLGKLAKDIPDSLRSFYDRERRFRGSGNRDTSIVSKIDYTGDGKKETQITRVEKRGDAVYVMNMVLCGADTILKREDEATFAPEYTQNFELVTTYYTAVRLAPPGPVRKTREFTVDQVAAVMQTGIKELGGGMVTREILREYIEGFEGALFHSITDEGGGCAYIWYAPMGKFIPFYCP